MKIGTRVKLAGLITLGVFLASGAVLVHMDRTVSHLAREANNSNKLDNTISLLRNLTQEYLLYRTERAQQQWVAVFDEVRRLLDDKEYVELQREYDLGNIGDKIKITGDTFRKLLTIQDSTSYKDSEDEIRSEIRNRLATQLLLTTQDLRYRFVHLSEEVNQRLIQTQRLASLSNILSLLVLGMIILGAGVFIQRSVVKPVLRLHEGTERIGAGKLDYKVGINSRDEIGALSQAFDRMTSNLKQLTVSRDELTAEIEERQRVEEALRKSEEQSRVALESADLGTWDLDLITGSMAHSLRHDQIFGYQELQPEWTYDTSVHHMLPEYRPVMQEAVAQAIKTGDLSCEVQVRWPDGSNHWIAPHGRVHYDSGGRAVRIVGVVADVTERKQAEERIKHLASFPQMNPAPVLELDLSGAITYYNQAAVNALEQMAPETHLSNLIPKDLSNIIDTIKTKKKKFFYREIELGSMVIAQNIFFTETFNVLRIYTMDITKRKRAEEKLQQALLDLARSNKELEEFAYVASHDLQEPLRKMANFSEMLADRYQGQLDDRANKYLGYITDGAKRLKILINDLLAFSRVGQADFTLTAADLNGILQKTLNDIQPLVREKQALITSEVLPTLKVNPHQMGQLLQNLITNAIKFHGDQPPRIHLTARQEGREWVMAVRDQGIGFDSQFAQDIFKVFRRLHTKEEYPGTGIGLAICQKIIERHGGRIWAEAVPGQGATFYFTIPG